MARLEIGALEIAMKAHAEALTKNVNVLTRNTARAILNRLSVSTPVDTGEAVSNWQVALNGPPANPLPPYVPGEGGSTRSMNAKAMLQTARSIIPKFYAVNGDTLFIGNTAPYIERLNKGSSTQAPAGFVEDAILAGAAHVRSAAPIISGKFNENAD